MGFEKVYTLGCLPCYEAGGDGTLIGAVIAVEGDHVIVRYVCNMCGDIQHGYYPTNE